MGREYWISFLHLHLVGMYVCTVQWPCNYERYPLIQTTLCNARKKHHGGGVISSASSDQGIRTH